MYYPQRKVTKGSCLNLSVCHADQNRLFLNGMAGFYSNGRHHSCCPSAQHIFHFHGFKDDHSLPFFDRLTCFDQDFQHLARHGRAQVFRGGIHALFYPHALHEHLTQPVDRPLVSHTIQPDVPATPFQGLDRNPVVAVTDAHPPKSPVIFVDAVFTGTSRHFLPLGVAILGHTGNLPLFSTEIAPMAGLYVHVPFCAQACSYCDFHFTTRLNDRSRMVDAIISEIKASMPGWSGHTFRTLYFGGGTPSILGAEAIGRIAEAAFQNADWALEEWTVEANPEDLNTAGLKALKDIGVGRLSVGIQSFDPDVLAWMRRIHSAETAESAVRRAAELGFDHISLDLMYGLPVGQETRWEDDLQRALALPADHLSCYILTAEPRTLYGNQLDKGQLTAPPDEQVVREYNTLCKSTSKAGFEHYEVSNFARPGGRSRHNSAYWDGTPYLGVGPGAHSFSDSKRWWNARSNAAFLRASEQGSEGIKKQQASEVLSNTDRFNEALITGLRRTEGVHPAELLKDTGLDLLAQDGLQTLIGRGDCEWHNGRLRIPEPRWPMGDAITLELMH